MDVKNKYNDSYVYNGDKKTLTETILANNETYIDIKLE